MSGSKTSVEMEFWWTLVFLLTSEPSGIRGFPTPSADPDPTASRNITYPETGPLHGALASYMTDRTDIKSLIAESPLRSVRRGKHSWSVHVWTLGEYGEGNGMLSMKPVGSYEKESWDAVFPCTLVRGATRADCRGSPPPGGDSETWTYVDLSEKTERWSGTVTALSETPEGEPKTFVATADCESMSELTLARTIQRGGWYAGVANITCRSTTSLFDVIVKGPGLDFQMRIHAGASGTPETQHGPFSWKAGVDELGRLVVSSGNRSIAYTKDDLSGNREVNLNGLKRTAVTYVYTAALEPRLCGLAAADAACSISRSVSSEELVALGAVTGFNVLHWNVDRNGTVFVRGYVLGTHGLLVGDYTAKATESNAPVWTELPLPGADGCVPRLYISADCQSLPSGAPTVSAYARGKIVQRPFPSR